MSLSISCQAVFKSMGKYWKHSRWVTFSIANLLLLTVNYYLGTCVRFLRCWIHSLWGKCTRKNRQRRGRKFDQWDNPDRLLWNIQLFLKQTTKWFIRIWDLTVIPSLQLAKTEFLTVTLSGAWARIFLHIAFFARHYSLPPRQPSVLIWQSREKRFSTASILNYKISGEAFVKTGKGT